MLEGNEYFKITKKIKLIGYDAENIIIAYIKPQFNSLNYNEILMDSIFDNYLINNVKKYKKDEISENYTRFNGKKIITCIFTLDRHEPYYIDWSDTIKNNKDIITDAIYTSIKKKYTLESNSIFYFYIYWRKFCPEIEKKPLNFINFLKEKLSDKLKLPNLPKYVYDFVSYIGFEIEQTTGKINKEKILQNYDNKEYFFKKLEEKLDVSIKRYLGLKLDDDDEDD